MPMGQVYNHSYAAIYCVVCPEGCAITLVLCDMENITVVGSGSDSVHFLWEKNYQVY